VRKGGLVRHETLSAICPDMLTVSLVCRWGLTDVCPPGPDLAADGQRKSSRLSNTNRLSGNQDSVLYSTWPVTHTNCVDCSLHNTESPKTDVTVTLQVDGQGKRGVLLSAMQAIHGL
jgi:hypothetical protein